MAALEISDRERWAVALASADPSRVAALANEISARAHVEALAPPSEGLMLLQMRDSVFGARFYLGEIPISSVHLRLSALGCSTEGGAILMSDDIETTTRIAILDAALAGGWPEADRIAELLTEGAAAWARIEAERALVLDRTRVDFERVTGSAHGND